MAISTNGAIITRVTSALYGQYLSNASYTEVKDTAAATVAASFLSNDFAGKTDMQVATTILKNLGLTSITGLDNWLSAQMTAAGSTAAAKGAKLVSILNDYANLTSDATYGSYATSFNAKVSAGLIKSQTTGAAGGAYATADAVEITNATISLTTGLDTGSKFTGGAGDDTFVSVDTQSATTQTLTSGDSLVGGAGTDTLQIAASGGAAVAAPLVSTSGIETLNVTNNNTGLYTIDSSLMSGLKTVQVTAGAHDVTVSGQTSILNASLISTSRSLTLSPASGTSGVADEMALTINGSGTAAGSTTTVTANGIETINLTSTGAASGNSTNSTRVTVASDALDKLVVTGEANARLTVNFAGASGTDVSTLDASKSTGGVNASITVGSSGNASIVGGTGNDAFTLGTMSKYQTVTGGEGTDTITVSAAAYSSTATTQTAANVSGFEVLSVAAGGSADVRAFSGNTGLVSFEAAGASATLSGLSTAAATVTAKATGGTVTVTRATDGTTDAMTVNLSATTPGTYTAVSIADEETITLASGGTATGDNTITTLTATDATSLTVTGARSLTVGTLAGATALATLNAGAHTGAVFSINASNSAANMTVTGSAGANATDGAVVNTITTGTGNDSITGGAFYDSLTGGTGNDTIIGGAGNDQLYGNANNDVLDGGEGDDTVDGDVGNDSLTGGAGNDTILASTGNDTVSGGAGNDAVYVATLNDDDSIDGGADTDTLSASAPTTTGAGATAAQYTDVTDSVTAKISGIETGYIQVTTTGSNTAATTALTVDMTGVSGMTTLWLDVADGNVGTTADDEFIVVKNFAGSTINLTELTGTTHQPESLTLDGVSQAALTVNVRSYATASTEATVFTGVEAVTVSGQSQINSANVTNTLGVVTANSASSATIRTSGSTISSANTGALKVDSLNANNALTVAVNAGAYDTLTVTQDVNATSGLVQTLDIDAAASAIINVDGGDFVLTGSSVRNAYIDLLADAQLYDNSDTNTVDIEATTIASLTMNLGANSKIGLDLDTAVTSGTVSMSSGSQWHVNTIGGSGAVTSITVTGTGDVDSGKTGGVIAPGITLIGSTATFNASGLTDADSLSIASTATTKATISLPLTATGAGEISSGAGADVLTGGNGADRFGLTGRTETFTVTRADPADTYAATINGVATATQTVAVAAGATDDTAHKTAVATQLAAAINATSATSFATATSNAAVVTVTYNQYFGVAGAFAATEVGGGTISAVTVAATAAGDNAGADTINGGLGQDTIMGGTGADSITGGSDLDTYLYINGDAAITIGGTGNAGTVSGYDQIIGFALGTASTNAETIDALVGTASVVANGATNGTNSTLTIGGVVVKSHSVASGIFTFDDDDTFATALSLTSLADVAAVVQYLQLQDLGAADAVTATFTATISGTTSTWMFIQGVDAGTDTADSLIELVGVTGLSVSATNGNTAGLIDIG
jgi:Ca2+-binding RTX toxin-like protein